MPGSVTTPDRSGTRVGVSGRVAFRWKDGVGIREEVLSRLDGWPV